MMRALYTARTGLDAHQFKLDVVANNLANANTNGFKRGRAIFADLMYQVIRNPVRGDGLNDGLPTGLTVGSGAAPIATARTHTEGSPTSTENPYDLALSGGNGISHGGGFFRVELQDGSTAYTRNGEFSLNQDGVLVNMSGHSVAPQIVIPPEATKFSVAPDGMVTYQTSEGEEMITAGQILTTLFVNPQGLLSIGDNLYVETTASGQPNEGIPGSFGRSKIKQGFAESSNVSVASEMIEMIITQRGFEVNIRAIKTADDMLGRLAQI